MLLKKLESFFLLLTFGLFLFSCTVEENKRMENPTQTSSEYKVSIEILNSESIEKSRFEFKGTLDGNPLNIPDDSAGVGTQEFTVSSKGLLKIEVRAYSLSSGAMTAYGEAQKEISGNTSFEIELKSSASEDVFYLTFNDEGTERKTSYSKNELVAELPSPVKDGYTFQGWFTQPNGAGTKLTTNYAMISDLTVYAYWTSNSSGISYTVTFETDGGSAVTPQTVAANGTIDKPAEPTKSGYTFTGWYSDSECSNLVSFPYSVTGNVTLYAGWTLSANVVKVTGVKLAQSSHTFENTGSTINLVPIVEPTNATNKSVTWASDNPIVATVNNGEITAVSEGTATITVTTDDGGYTATCSITVKVSQVVSVTGVTLDETTKTLGKSESFTLTATVSPADATNKAVKWTTSDSAVVSVSGGKVTALAAGTAKVTVTTVDGAYTAECSVTVTDPLDGKTIIFVKADSAPNIWAWEVEGVELTKTAGGAWENSSSATLMTDAKYMNDPTGWYMIDYTSVATGKAISFKLNWVAPEIVSGKSGTFWYDGTVFYDDDPTKPVIVTPSKPAVTISPASGNISLSGSVKVTFTDGNDTITSAKVLINGTSYNMGTTAGTFTKSVKDLGITAGGTTITVSAEVTNGEGTTTAKATLTTIEKPAVADTFTWDNANVYFVIQDRFYDGDSSNNNSYGRMSKDDLGKTIGTFHGGDIKGLTEKLDYLNNLGVNALWITAPYEQAHGWCGGGSNGDFAHYAYHGYYPLDYTMMDKNMGTVEEFRTFVTECHKRGIRVVMDVVMNHTGYLTLQDCQDYSIAFIFKSSFNGGKSTDMGFKIGSDGANYHAHHDKIDYSGHNDGWAKWWGSSWVRAGVPGYTAGDKDNLLTQNLDNLPDVKTENTTAQTAAPILQTKWGKETNGYDNWIIPAAKSLRSTTDKNAPAVWIEKWLAAWVEEFGIDGFRCDTAKHVDKYRWGELKALCKTALANWRNSSRADEYAKGWDEEFWMTGEAFGWVKGEDSSWFSNGFDSMIDFTVAKTSGMKTYSPNLPSWEDRMGDSQALLYISSHDTGLGRASNQVELGTSFVLMPGLIQIYYGDETSRAFGETGSDENQGTRSDFNWDASTGTTATHWGKLGTFRKFNPAVGAGTGSGTKRSYSGAAGESKVAIGISGTSVDVSGLFSDGTTVYNWYDGKSAVVSGGKVTSFTGGTKNQPILVSDKNPADYGVSF